jgi:protoporphyrinogen oxidase
MKIVILGGGVTGLAAAHYLSNSQNEIVVIEKGERLGGLASGFRKDGWAWELERTYHHIFSNDEAILCLAREIGFNSFVFSSPITASLFGDNNNYRIFPVDRPQDFLLLPTLSLISKLRAGVVIVFLKLSPFLPWFEKITSAEFLKKTMGGEVWSVLWEQLFRKKYGKYAENILASFIWARIHKRTQKLGYPTGGFQRFVDALAQSDEKKGITILRSSTIRSVQKTEGGYMVDVQNQTGETIKKEADVIISTLPYPITCAVMGNVLGEGYVRSQQKRKYLFAINLILKTKSPILSKEYWLNVGAPDIPIMCVVQHTNFANKKEYGGDNLCYVAWYVEEGSDLLKKTEQEMLSFVLPYLKNISSHLEDVPEVVGLFKAPFAQPIFDAEFASISREFATPAKNVFVANMDMTYPFDRGTNYAVQLGKDVSNLILKKI